MPCVREGGGHGNCEKVAQEAHGETQAQEEAQAHEVAAAQDWALAVQVGSRGKARGCPVYVAGTAALEPIAQGQACQETRDIRQEADEHCLPDRQRQGLAGQEIEEEGLKADGKNLSEGDGQARWQAGNG